MPLTNLLEWHIRGFADGALDSEVEISRDWLQHLAAKPGPYYSPLLAILKNHGIPYSVERMIPSDAFYIHLPEFFGRTIPVRVPQTSWPSAPYF